MSRLEELGSCCQRRLTIDAPVHCVLLHHWFALFVTQSAPDQYRIALFKVCEQGKIEFAQAITVERRELAGQNKVDQSGLVAVMVGGRCFSGIAPAQFEDLVHDFERGSGLVTQLAPVVFTANQAIDLSIAPDGKPSVEPLSESNSKFRMEPCPPIFPSSGFQIPPFGGICDFTQCRDVVLGFFGLEPVIQATIKLCRRLSRIEPPIILISDRVALIGALDELHLGSHFPTWLGRADICPVSAGIEFVKSDLPFRLSIDIYAEAFAQLLVSGYGFAKVAKSGSAPRCKILPALHIQRIKEFE